MGKVFSRKVISTAVASSLLFSAGSAVVFAAPKEDTKETGVITINEVTVPRYATAVWLTGTVVIDGPQLVVAIPGSKNITVTKVHDKFFTYKAEVDVSLLKGDAQYKISAHTIHDNGQKAGEIHTSAQPVSQTIHVPYVLSTVAKNTNWTEYDRTNNEFILKYDEYENWSLGDPVITAKSLTVSGSENEVTILGETVEVPTANRYITFSEEATWVFDAAAKTYSGTAEVSIINSKGNVVKTVPVTRTGLQPEGVHEFSYSEEDKFGTVEGTVSYSAPKAPVVAVVVDKLENLKFTHVRQNKNQFKVTATYQLGYSDGTTGAKVFKLEDNLGDPSPESKSNNPSTRNWDIGGFIYKVTLHYDTVKGHSLTYDFVSKK